jgi:hypothetical protein
LTIWDLHLCRPRSLGWYRSRPMWRIGCIRHVGEWAAGRHGQGGSRRGRYEYSGHRGIGSHDRGHVWKSP